MKLTIYMTTFLLTLASFSGANATGALGSKVPHLSHSAANPSNARIPFANYHVGLHVSGYSLSQITVDLPQDLTVSRDIMVQTKTGQKIEATVSIADGKAQFIFAQPIAPETMLELIFNSVKTSMRVSHIWLLPVTGQRADTKIEIPLGTARIHTYD
jgi:hypothetical protein